MSQPSLPTAETPVDESVALLSQWEVYLQYCKARFTNGEIDAATMTQTQLLHHQLKNQLATQLNPGNFPPSDVSQLLVAIQNLGKLSFLFTSSLLLVS